MSGPTHTGLYGGALVDLVNPDWRLISLNAVAHSLARMPRFLGHTDRPVSVLEHSLAVAGMVPERYRLAALLHDAHEALMGNFTRPTRVALEAMSSVPGLVSSAIERLADRLDRAIVLQVLTLSPTYGGEEAGGTLHHTAAAGVVGELRSDPVVTMDHAACEMEIRAFTGWRPDAALPPNIRDYYNALPPDPDALKRAWLDCVEDICLQRFGGPRRAPAKIRSGWLWGGAL